MSRRKKQFSVRLPSDTADAVEQYAEERDLANADALRRACDEFFVQTDGGKVYSRLEELERRERREEEREFARHNVVTVALAIIYIGTVLADLIAGLPAAVLGGVLLILYYMSWFSPRFDGWSP